MYTDSARSSIWGDGSAGTQTVSDGYLLGLLTVTRHYPVYGRIPADQNVSPGVYLDTIFVTVLY
ncbi:spore coat U domain-containing protein [Methylocaldum marinum]|uniref:Spore coat U domain-containing protein n=1 Tax=Methylocaldum marinum TaxID=1432792 RepID=A0A250KQP8_9GAMM|nr:spore coat U domain-containing protein [Methylocaldum marinum]